MKVTAIKTQVKQRGRYSVFVDERYSFSLSELALINSGIKVGQELTKEDIAAYKDESKLDKLYNRALDLIVRRPRSEWELRDYLRRKGLEAEEIDSLLNKLSKAGFVDDYDFARRWVADRRLLKSTSRRRLTQELRQKRISDDIIQRVLEEDETDDREVLRELVKRKRQQSKYQDDLKLMQYLSRQGYSYDDIKSVLAGSVEEET